MGTEKAMRIGELRIRGIRLGQYANIGTFLAAVATGVTVDAFPWWAVVVCVALLAILALADPKVLQGEFQYQNENNEQWQQLRKDIQTIRDNQKGMNGKE